MLNLNSDLLLPSGAFLVFGDFNFYDSSESMSVLVSLHSAPDTDAFICGATLVVTNMQSSVLSRQATPPVGLRIENTDRYFVIGVHDTPTGYTDAWAAILAAPNTPADRKAALEAHMVTAGHISPVTFAGTYTAVAVPCVCP